MPSVRAAGLSVSSEARAGPVPRSIELKPALALHEVHGPPITRHISPDVGTNFERKIEAKLAACSVVSAALLWGGLAALPHAGSMIDGDMLTDSPCDLPRFMSLLLFVVLTPLGAMAGLTVTVQRKCVCVCAWC